jgi:hypothetical protein
LLGCAVVRHHDVLSGTKVAVQFGSPSCRANFAREA